MKPWENRDYLEAEYEQKQRSTSDIAKEHGVYPTTIRRALKKHGFKIRGKAQAQKINVMRNGTPTQGRKRTAEEKERISKGLQKFWDELSEDEVIELKSRLSETAKSNWESLSDKEQEDVLRRMHNASREVSGLGSKNENMTAELLRENGYSVFQRLNDFTPGRQFEVDICIPKERVAIEWDGATHFDPIYGEEHLAKVQEKDGRKNAVLIAAGWTVIRCRDMSTAPTMAFCRRTVEKIIDVIHNGDKNVVHIIEAK